MAETKPGEEIERDLRHDTDELDERIDRLGDHIGEARKRAQASADQNKPLEDTAGDWEDTEPDSAVGDDPSAFDDPEAEEDDEE